MFNEKKVRREGEKFYEVDDDKELARATNHVGLGFGFA